MSHIRNAGITTARKKMVSGTHKIYFQLNLSTGETLESRNKSNVVATHGTEWGEHLKKLKTANKQCKDDKTHIETLKNACESAKKFLDSLKSEDPLRMQAWKAALSTYEKFLVEYTRDNTKEMKVETHPLPIQRSKNR